jgi:hypothetical protein
MFRRDLAAPTLDALSGLRCALYWKDGPRTEAQQKDGEKGRWWTATDQPHAQGVTLRQPQWLRQHARTRRPLSFWVQFDCSLYAEKTSFGPWAVRVAWPVGTLH